WHKTSPFVSGEWVEGRSEAEIAASLDRDGKLDGVLFMPEMRELCGRRLRIHRRVEKTCVEGYGVRRMRGTVLLEDARCTGASHDGCQRSCLLFWKEAWLKPVADHAACPEVPSAAYGTPAAALLDNLETKVGDRYRCQSTELAAATEPLSPWDPRPLLAETIAGDLPASRLVLIVVRVLTNRVRRLIGLLELGVPPGERGKHSRGDLDLLPGDRVEVRPLDEIRQTLDPSGRNCGLRFEPDMNSYAGRHFTVEHPIKRIIREDTGKMVTISNTVALKGVVCAGVCCKNCPRANPHFWRESWLRRAAPERVEPAE
ncbi:MAG TPA: hypothetical protein PK413_19780, partial [Thermoanaerobaculia bacterium]|nr:hypothetical protein [Thermoanaerobaculia bacterium]